MDCLDENALAALTEGALSAAIRHQAESHLDGCVTCFRAMVEVVRMRSTSSGAVAPTGPATAPALGPTQGTEIGRYVVERTVGVGGMGIVYAARDRELDRSVALKLLRGRASPDAEARLHREAKALGKLNHPNVVAIYEVARWNGQLFIAMELVPGTTLRRWLTAERETGAILDKFVQAGRALSTAHAVGLVHRDFKPDNVMVGDDGRVRVMDFGLVKVGDAEHANELRVGTPAYMPPEQRDGRSADARADQFSFCLSLAEALYGSRATALPRGRGIARRVRRALLRGLAVAPTDRYPSMDELLVELVPKRRSTALLLATSAATLLGVAGLSWAGFHSRALCRDVAKLDGTWDSTSKAALVRVFAASGRSFAAATAPEVVATLDNYAVELGAMRSEACVATRIRGDQSDQLLSLRTECLDRKQMALGALVDVLSKADAEVVDHAAIAVRSLPPIAQCANKAALLARVPPPDDPALAREVNELRVKIARSRALYDAGRYSEGLTQATPVAQAARATGYKPVYAEALLARGLLELGDNKPKDAEVTLHEAASTAEASRQDEVAAEAWLGLLETSGIVVTQLDDARRDEERATAAVERLGDAHQRVNLFDTISMVRVNEDRPLEAVAAAKEAVALATKIVGPEDPRTTHELETLAAAFRSAQELAEALALDRQVVAAYERQLGADHPDTITARNELANTLLQLGELDEARRIFERALSARERLYGPDHDLISGTLLGLGLTQRRLGDLDAALVSFRRALRISERIYGPSNPTVAVALGSVGQILAKLGRLDEARQTLERTLEMQLKTLGRDHVDTAYTENVLAWIAREQGRWADALAGYQRSLAILDKAIGPEHLDHASDWNGIGRVYLASQRAGLAIAPIEHALALRTKFQGPADELAETQFLLAHALWDGGGDRRRARALATTARATFAKAGRTHDVADADAWLATHRG
jgi:tetratricopeptide (TPR) repeat protein